ncbi:hypothetical protein GCM10009677_16640 [Sphaerisporangium rubeum]
MLDTPARSAIRTNDAWLYPTSAITSIAAATICALRAAPATVLLRPPRSPVTRMSKNYLSQVTPARFDTGRSSGR